MIREAGKQEEEEVPAGGVHGRGGGAAPAPEEAQVLGRRRPGGAHVQGGPVCVFCLMAWFVV